MNNYVIEKKPFIEVNLDNFHTKYYILDELTQYMERTHTILKKKNIFDTVGSGWLFGFTCFDNDTVFANYGEKLVEINGPKGIIIPPYEIVHWSLNPSKIKWVAFRSEKDFSGIFPAHASFYDWDMSWSFRSIDELILLIKKNITTFTNISKEHNPKPIAKITKNYIDQNYKENIEISQISKNLNVEHTNLTRNFKKSYGLSPITYRNQLRVFDSIRMMIVEKKGVTETCYDTGFNDFSRFSRNFKTIFAGKPAMYKWKKNSQGSMQAQ